MGTLTIFDKINRETELDQLDGMRDEVAYRGELSDDVRQAFATRRAELQLSELRGRRRR